MHGALVLVIRFAFSVRLQLRELFIIVIIFSYFHFLGFHALDRPVPGRFYRHSRVPFTLGHWWLQQYIVHINIAVRIDVLIFLTSRVLRIVNLLFLFISKIVVVAGVDFDHLLLGPAIPRAGYNGILSKDIHGASG